MNKQFPKNGLVKIGDKEVRVRDLSLIEMDFLGIALTYEEALFRLEMEENTAAQQLDTAAKALREAEERHRRSWNRLEFLGKCLKHSDEISIDRWEVSPKVRQKLGEIE